METWQAWTAELKQSTKTLICLIQTWSTCVWNQPPKPSNWNGKKNKCQHNIEGHVRYETLNNGWNIKIRFEFIFCRRKSKLSLKESPVSTRGSRLHKTFWKHFLCHMCVVDWFAIDGPAPSDNFFVLFDQHFEMFEYLIWDFWGDICGFLHVSVTE